MFPYTYVIGLDLQKISSFKNDKLFLNTKYKLLW